MPLSRLRLRRVTRLTRPSQPRPRCRIQTQSSGRSARSSGRRSWSGRLGSTGATCSCATRVRTCARPTSRPLSLTASPLLAAAIKAKSNLKKTIKLAICEGEDGTESSNGDVLIFPDMKRYKGLHHFDVDNFVEEVLEKDIDWLPGSPKPISGCYVFVFSHGSRDKGRDLIKRFKEEINGLGLDGQVCVSACSHVGGHKYAGNVIIFSSHANGEVTGQWYGYVVPDDVPVLLHKHIGQEVVDHLWRGQMGLSKEQQKQALKLRSMINGGKESLEETGTDGASCNPAAAGGCCQGNGGFTCCQTDLPKEKQDKTIAAEQNPKSCPALRMKRSKLLPSPARDMERRLTPTPHRPNLHQGRKGSPCLSYSDWSPAPREKENERCRSSLSAVKQEMPKWAEKDIRGNGMRPLSHKERERAPLMENYLPPNQPESSRPAWGQGMPGKGMKPQVDRSIYWKERGLIRPWGEREVAQVRNSGCHTPWHYGSNPEREDAKGMRPQGEWRIYWNEKVLSRPQVEREVAQVRNGGCHTQSYHGRNPECKDAKDWRKEPSDARWRTYWRERKHAGGSQSHPGITSHTLLVTRAPKDPGPLQMHTEQQMIQHVKHLTDGKGILLEVHKSHSGMTNHTQLVAQAIKNLGWRHICCMHRRWFIHLLGHCLG